MIDPGWDKQLIEDLGGEWNYPDETDNPPDKATRSWNNIYIPGQVLTRNGFASIFTPSDIVLSMFNWLFGSITASSNNFLVWLKAGYGVRNANLASPGTGTNLYTVSGTPKGAVFANAGDRFYAAHYNAAGVGVDGGKVYGNGVGADDLFVRPMLTTEVTLACGAASAGGECTEGVRYVGFIMTSRNGFTGRPAPANTSLVLVPTAGTTTAANKQFLVTVTPTTVWPSSAATLHLIMTTTYDYTKYFFVPLADLATPAGGGIAVTFTISISDDALVNSTDASSYFNLTTQNSAGTAPFNPSAVFPAGSRMAYVIRSSELGQGIMYSDPDEFQKIAAGSNMTYLPGKIEPITGVYMDKTNYSFAANGTYAQGDSGGAPVTWVAPDCVDASIGTNCPEGISFDVANGRGWVAHTSGLYRFVGGRYNQMPVSYMNSPTWKRINWPVASYTLRVVDCTPLKTVCVAAPLNCTGVVATSGTAVTWTSGDEFSTAWLAGDTIVINSVSYTISSVASNVALTLTGSAGTQSGVTYTISPSTNTHMLTWNYTGGDTVDAVKFSLWFINSIGPSAICTVQNATTKFQELWAGPSVAGSFYRMKQDTETNVYRDGSLGIDSVYYTGLFGHPTEAGIAKHHGAQIRVYGGGGNLIILASTMDDAQTATLRTITLASAPGKEYFCGMRLISERIYYQFGNANQADRYFKLSLIRHFTSSYALSRPL